LDVIVAFTTGVIKQMKEIQQKADGEEKLTSSGVDMNKVIKYRQFVPVNNVNG
jgi:hypothetical protein